MTTYTLNDQTAVNAIRALSIDMIENAGSGHPGLPLDAAPMLYVLYKNYLRFDPRNPNWFGRDRFILSAGHGSAMLYSILHLLGYDLSISDLKDFRKLNSKTPGHPELGTPGIDASTGPLGQGMGMAVGMAMAAKHLATKYNSGENQLIDNKIYTLVSDGDLMEGISHEAASLAGHLKLNNLIVLYDSNDITLDAKADKSMNDNVKNRFSGYNWNYIKVEDGNDLTEIDNALNVATSSTNAPTIIEVKTVLGYGSPKENQTVVHGNPLGIEGVEETKKFFNWNYEPFDIPDKVYKTYQEIVHDKQDSQELWKKRLETLHHDDESTYENLLDHLTGKIKIPDFHNFNLAVEPEATRNTIHKLLQQTVESDFNFWGGSADLSSSNKTYFENDSGFEPDSYQNKNIYFGVREFASAAAVNGITIFGGTKAFTSTFFVFSDYMRNAIRMAALQNIPSIFLFSHDSIALGPDGPTHQPIEQLDSIRAIPNVTLFRPADSAETLEAWKISLNNQEGPVVIAMSRQPLAQHHTQSMIPEVNRGAYVLSSAHKSNADGILMASGSEVDLALQAQTVLFDKGHDVTVVSVPSQELFDSQELDYRQSVLPNNIRNRMSIEMGSTQSWSKYVGIDGISIGIDSFGASGNADELIKQRGFSVEHVVNEYLDHFDK